MMEKARREGMRWHLLNTLHKAMPYTTSEQFLRDVMAGIYPNVTLTLKNGFNVVGTSACVDEANYNQEIGDKVAFEDAFDKIWVLEGYLLKQKMHEKKQAKLRNGNEVQIVYESDFGKLLVVEFNGDELPPVHWHNANGSYWADEPSELDIVEGLDA